MLARKLPVERDYQRAKVYRWEDANVPSGAWLTFNQIESYVVLVWAELGLSHPPRVSKIPAHNKKAAGTGCRTELRFPAEGATQHTVLHEIAHAITSDINGRSDWHGPKFVGEFMRIAAPRLDVPLFYLWSTAQKAGVEFERIL